MDTQQPLNDIAPFETELVIADTLLVADKIVFKDGSTMQSAGSGLPPVIDSGTY